MKEIFKDIPGYEGRYQVSDFGNVKSLERFVRQQKGRLRIVREKMLNPSIHQTGYLYVNLHKNNRNKIFKVHKLVAMAFLNHVPKGYQVVVDHIDNNPLNNNLSNLQLVSQRENSSKRKKAGSSKYTGVCWYKYNNKWLSSIGLIGERGSPLFLGYFKYEIDASKQYQKALKYILDNNLKSGDITAKELREKLKAA